MMFPRPWPTTFGFLLAAGMITASDQYGTQDKLVYKDPSYTALERATDLLERMTWEEKVGQMGGVRALLGADLAFNETSYNSIRQLQNGILGIVIEFLEMLSCVALIRCAIFI